MQLFGLQTSIPSHCPSNASIGMMFLFFVFKFKWTLIKTFIQRRWLNGKSFRLLLLAILAIKSISVHPFDKSTAIKLKQQLISNVTPIHCRCHKIIHIQLIAIKSDFIRERESWWSSTWHKNKIQCIFMRLNLKLFAIEIHLTKYALALCSNC